MKVKKCHCPKCFKVWKKEGDWEKPINEMKLTLETCLECTDKGGRE